MGTFSCAVKALIFKGDKFLIIKRSTEARGDPFKWECPGGGLEFGETPQEGIIREVKEETGLKIDCGFPIAAWTFFKGDRQAIGITFLCAAQQTDNVVLSREHLEYAWVSRVEISHYDLATGVANEMKSWDWDYIQERSVKYA